jgi:hypothetical protein
MRKIKHFMGYGTVGMEAKKTEYGFLIKVSGEHECGTDFTYYQGLDVYTLTEWLLKKVDKTVTSDDVARFTAEPGENGDTTIYRVHMEPNWLNSHQEKI